MWQDIHIIFTMRCTHKERTCIWSLAHSWADEAHTCIPDHAVVGVQAGPMPTLDGIIKQETLAELISTT